MVDFLNRNARFFGLFSGEVSSRVSFPFGSADSPSSSVHCAPDEKDRISVHISNGDFDAISQCK